MKLLFDNNLSPRLVRLLADLYPGSAHVRSFNLQTASDQAVWRHARDAGFVIAAKDDDFRQLAFLFGAPPKVIWVALGNCATDEIEPPCGRGTRICRPSTRTRWRRSSS